MTVDETQLRLIAEYQRMRREPAARAKARGVCFNGFLAQVLRHDGLDAVSDQRGLHGRDETDVVFYFDGTHYILEAKWTKKRVSDDPIGKLHRRLRTRQTGVRGVMVSMSRYTRDALNTEENFADVILLDGSHVEAMVCGLLPPQQLLHQILSVTTRRGGSYVPLADLLRPAMTPDLPRLRPTLAGSDDPVTVQAGPGVTVTPLLTAHGPWTDTASGMAVTKNGDLLWTLDSGILRVAPVTGTTSWHDTLQLCYGPVIPRSDDTLIAVRAGAALRTGPTGITALGGGFNTFSYALPGTGDDAWVFSSTGPTGEVYKGSHTLTRLGDTLADSAPHSIEFSGGVHQAAITPAGTVYLSGGGDSVTADLAPSMDGNTGWFASVPVVTPTTSLVLDDHTVLLAGRVGNGIETAVYAADTRTRSYSQLARLHGTYDLTAVARDRDGAIYLLADIRGNSPTPHPHLLRLTR
ncbi:restriction endonuclease [Actinacidiphila oryziradicis]|nr:restriction endonuclease [Actinacidiphila oryziradicis]